MPIARSPVQTRSRSNSRTSSYPSLLEVNNNPVAPSEQPPPVNPTAEANKRRGRPRKGPLFVQPPIEQQLEDLNMINGDDQQAGATRQATARAAEEAREAEVARAAEAARAAAVARAPAAVIDWEAFRNALVRQRPALPEFSVKDHEDPEAYLTQCDAYLRILEIQVDQVRSLEKGLKGEAEKWWKCYISMGVDWRRFQELIRSRFNSDATKNSLNARLYGVKQGERESVGAFLQQKYMLYHRLRPEEPEQSRITMMIGLLQPSLRKVIRPQAIQDFSDLLTKALEAEHDEAEEKAQHKIKATTYTAEEKPTANKQSQAHPPKCWHCPGYHFHKDCDVFRAKQH